MVSLSFLPYFLPAFVLALLFGLCTEEEEEEEPPPPKVFLPAAAKCEPYMEAAKSLVE